MKDIYQKKHNFARKLLRSEYNYLIGLEILGSSDDLSHRTEFYHNCVVYCRAW